MATNVAKQLLQELIRAKHYRQLPSYRASEVDVIATEVRDRKQILDELFVRQRDDIELTLQALDAAKGEMNALGDDLSGFGTYSPEYEEARNTCKTMLERLQISTQYPNVALLAHVVEIQQLQRGLHIYRFERYQWIVQIVVEGIQSHGLTADSLKQGNAPRGISQIMSRLSEDEAAVLVRMVEILDICGSSTWLRGLGVEPDHNLDVVVTTSTEAPHARYGTQNAKVIMPDLEDYVKRGNNCLNFVRSDKENIPEIGDSHPRPTMDAANWMSEWTFGGIDELREIKARLIDESLSSSSAGDRDQIDEAVA